MTHMIPGMATPQHSDLETAVNAWHEAVNSGDLDRCAEAVGDPVVVLGPKGAGPISPADFAGWVARSGIRDC